MSSVGFLLFIRRLDPLRTVFLRNRYQMNRKHASLQNEQNRRRKNAIIAQDDCSRLHPGYPQNPTEEIFKVISGMQSEAMVSSGYACFKIVLFLRRTYVQLKLEVLARAQGYSCFMPQTSLDYYRGAPSDHMTGVKQHNDPKKFEIDRNHCFATIL